MGKVMILALDISTTTVGYALVDKDSNLHYCGHIDLSKVDCVFEKVNLVMDVLKQYRHMTTDIAIESPLTMFKKGASSAQVLSRLTQFNGMVSVMLWREFGMKPKYINVNTARRLALPDVKFPKGCNRKQIVLDAIVAKYEWVVPLSSLAETYGWVVECKRTGKPKDFMYDRADACVIGIAAATKKKG
jgi:hypothetical protein